MGSQPGVLISQMEPPPGERDEFDAWYADEHVPLRMALPGFTGAVRAWAPEGEPRHLVVYHLSSPTALESPEYLDVKENPSELTAHMLGHVGGFTRYIAEEIGDTGDAPPGRYLYLVTFDVPAAAEAEFDAWYESDHVPTLIRCEHWLRIRRYAVGDSIPAGVTRAALHELSDLAALESPERAEARASDWRRRLADEPWFSTARYAVYERYQDFAGTA